MPNTIVYVGGKTEQLQDNHKLTCGSDLLEQG